MSLPALKDLFERHRTRATGHWRLGQEANRTVYLELGDIVFATSTHPLDRLTHLLVERGKITQAQLDYAMENLKPTMSIGKNLIEMGFITQRDLLDVAKGQVERVVWTCLATPDMVPTFEAQELDARIVRLPFDTPAMLLAGVLSLGDRELVLEELGALNQVVLLEGRRLQELTLPPDLIRLPGLLDGTRTLLELSREVGVEPFRLGAFALFLREMGWARLHELPPLDRGALERALEPPEAAITPALPDPDPEPPAPLFEELPASPYSTQDVSRPSEALEVLSPEDEVPEEATPVAPEAPPAPEPALPIHHEMVTGELEADPELEVAAAPPAPARRTWLLLLLIPILGLGLWAGRRWARRPRPAAPASAPTPKVDPPPAPAPAPEAAQPAPPPAAEPKAAPEAPEAPKAVPAKAGGIPSKAQRLQTITQGDWKRAMVEGAAQREALQSRWTLRLEIACQGETIQQAAQLLKGQDPDLFIVPMTMRDGRTCYQVFLGSYGSEPAAKAAAQGLPAPFLAEGNRPKPFRVAQIPDRQ